MDKSQKHPAQHEMHGGDLDTDHPDLKRLEAEGYDRSDPSPIAIWITIALTVLGLAAVFVGVTIFYDKVYEHQVEAEVLTKPNPDLADLRAKETLALSKYSYIDKEKKIVRLPIDRAMALLVEQSKTGKTFYPGKPTPFKTPEQMAAAAAAPPPAGGTAPAVDGTQPAPAAAGAKVEQKH